MFVKARPPWPPPGLLLASLTFGLTDPSDGDALSPPSTPFGLFDAPRLPKIRTQRASGNPCQAISSPVVRISHL
jgi:hypothetical protein